MRGRQQRQCHLVGRVGEIDPDLPPVAAILDFKDAGPDGFGHQHLFAGLGQSFGGGLTCGMGQGGPGRHYIIPGLGIAHLTPVPFRPQ